MVYVCDIGDVAHADFRKWPLSHKLVCSLDQATFTFGTTDG
jgi:hypothetical protein